VQPVNGIALPPHGIHLAVDTAQVSQGIDHPAVCYQTEVGSMADIPVTNEV
jgi:hypothetical protein